MKKSRKMKVFWDTSRFSFYNLNPIPPKYLPLNFAHGSCGISLEFGPINVKKKSHRAHSTFNIVKYFFMYSNLRSEADKIRIARG